MDYCLRFVENSSINDTYIYKYPISWLVLFLIRMLIWIISVIKLRIDSLFTTPANVKHPFKIKGYILMNFAMVIFSCLVFLQLIQRSAAPSRNSSSTFRRLPRPLVGTLVGSSQATKNQTKVYLIKALYYALWNLSRNSVAIDVAQEIADRNILFDVTEKPICTTYVLFFTIIM